MPSVAGKRKARSGRGNAEDGARLVSEEDPEMEEFGAPMRHFFEPADDEGTETSDDVAPMVSDGRLRLRPEIALDGPQYSGRKTSRKNKSHESESEEESQELSEELLQNSELEYDSSVSEEDGQLGLEATAVKDDELDALSREYADLRKQEEAVLRNLKTGSLDDVQKGISVRNQKVLWDRGLEYRISLQKVLSGANRLPRGQAKHALCKDVAVNEAYTALMDSAFQTFGLISDLQQAIRDRNAAIMEPRMHTQTENDVQGKDSPAATASSISSVDDAWDRMTALYSSMVPYRNSSLDRWQRKTQLSVGGAASKLRLRSLNQSITEQVAAIMRDPSRILNRARGRRSSVHVLGQAKSGDAEDTTPAHQTSEDVDLELFDDSEFYEQLLQEFFESSANKLGDLHPDGIRKLRNKKRKTVDRRASKGRKIRYNVFDPLVNFCAPEPMVLPAMTSQLFGNLFGHSRRDKNDVEMS